MGLESYGLTVKRLRLLGEKVALSLSFTYVKGGLRGSRKPPPLPWDPGDIRSRAKVESGFRDNLVSALQSEGIDGGVWLGGWHLHRDIQCSRVTSVA